MEIGTGNGPVLKLEREDRFQGHRRHFPRDRKLTINVVPVARHGTLRHGTILFPPKNQTVSFLSENGVRKKR